MLPFWYIRSVVLPFVCVVTLLVLINYGSVCGIIQINAAGFNSRIACGGGGLFRWCLRAFLFVVFSALRGVCFMLDFF